MFICRCGFQNHKCYESSEHPKILAPGYKIIVHRIVIDRVHRNDRARLSTFFPWRFTGILLNPVIQIKNSGFKIF